MLGQSTLPTTISTTIRQTARSDTAPVFGLPMIDCDGCRVPESPEHADTAHNSVEQRSNVVEGGSYGHQHQASDKADSQPIAVVRGSRERPLTAQGRSRPEERRR
jgi:hypothetical protein